MMPTMNETHFGFQARLEARRRASRFLVVCVGVSVFAGGLAGGCSQYIDPNVPEPIRPFADPAGDRAYLLYRPSEYDRNLSWPLVVVCHGAFPDSANRQIRAWTALAESRGFLVLAPTLTSEGRSKPRRLEKRLAQLRDDEVHILSAIQHVRAGHRVSWDRIFIYGWGTGSRVAVFSALGNRRLFRALAVAEPRIGEGVLNEMDSAIDAYLPVSVRYEMTDAITGKHGKRLEDWMRDQGANLDADNFGAVKQSDTVPAIEFFEESIRRTPFIQILTTVASNGGGNPMKIQFKARCSFKPVRYRWEFGDAGISTTAEPSHIFRETGSHDVTLTVEDAQRKVFTRTVKVAVQ